MPAIAYGGPKVAPDQPSPESEKIAESLVLVEFIADLFPDSGLLPKDPVQRAKARFFIESVSGKISQTMGDILYKGASPDAFLPAIDSLHAIGDQYTIADVAVAPFLGRLEILFSNDLGKYPPGEGKKVDEVLRTDAKYARYREYWGNLKSRKSFEKTFDAVRFLVSSTGCGFFFADLLSQDYIFQNFSKRLARN